MCCCLCVHLVEDLTYILAQFEQKQETKFFLSREEKTNDDDEKKNIESSIQKYVRDKNLEISHYITTYEAVSINREQAELLKCKKGTPAMKILNRGILENGMVYEYSEIIDIDYSCTYFIPFNKQNHSFRQLVP